MHRRFIPIHTPCNIDWSSLSPRGKHRFCGECQKVVHDLSALSEHEVRGLMAEPQRELCVRYLYDAQGTIHFADSPLVTASSLKRRPAAAAVLAVAPLLFQACGGAADGLPFAQLAPTSTLPCVEPALNEALDAGPKADAGYNEDNSPTFSTIPCVPATEQLTSVRSGSSLESAGAANTDPNQTPSPPPVDGETRAME